MFDYPKLGIGLLSDFSNIFSKILFYPEDFIARISEKHRTTEYAIAFQVFCCAVTIIQLMIFVAMDQKEWFRLTFGITFFLFFFTAGIGLFLRWIWRHAEKRSSWKYFAPTYFYHSGLLNLVCGMLLSIGLSISSKMTGVGPLDLFFDSVNSLLFVEFSQRHIYERSVYILLPMGVVLHISFIIWLFFWGRNAWRAYKAMHVTSKWGSRGLLFMFCIGSQVIGLFLTPPIAILVESATGSTSASDRTISKVPK